MSTNGHRVVVTGVGVVSPLGLTAPIHFDELLAGTSAMRRSEQAHFSSYAGQMEAPVQGFDRRKAITNRMLRKLLSPSAGYAVAAAGEAIADAGLADDTAALKACGLYVGSLSLEIDPEIFLPPLKAALTPSGEFDISLFARRGIRLLDPLFLVRALPNAGVCGISVEHQVLGPNTNLTNGGTSGLMAVGLAMSAIRRGEVTCAVAGGYDTLLVLDSIAEHLINGRLSAHGDDPARAVRPFDRTRDGYVVGEGAAYVVVEEAEHAAARGAAVYAELHGVGMTTDTHLLRPGEGSDGTALAAAASMALGNDDTVDRLGAVFGDGLGTRVDDLREAAALTSVLGGGTVPFTAATPAMGYTGAAGGVFNLVHAALSLRRGVVPGLANCDDPDPECPVYFTPTPAPMDGNRALVWNSDRGVKNVAVVAGAVPG